MNQTIASAVDQYISTLFVQHDAALDGALARADAAGLPAINVAPAQGAMLQVLALACGARRILELGTLGGYSTIWLARALPPDGHLVSLEFSPHHAEVARANLAAAGLAERVEVRVGPALALLPPLIAAGGPPFDLVFIDADKPPYAEYLEAALQLTRPGGLIIADNVVRDGKLIDPASDDPAVQGVRRFCEALAAAQQAGRVATTVVQTVGQKGYDGFALTVVR